MRPTLNIEELFMIVLIFSLFSVLSVLLFQYVTLPVRQMIENFPPITIILMQDIIKITGRACHAKHKNYKTVAYAYNNFMFFISACVAVICCLKINF